ncbi:hypothetical protein ACQR0V_12140 [Bradyrhizobium sp. HKCCYLS2058]|uniref:hypothetical protein n=1 Tax=unclassified Bradyrhizobium TaxID=2631580 RepID=UPI003EBC2D12
MNDSDAARSLMTGIARFLEMPDDLKFTDLADGIDEVGADGVIGELIDYTLTKRGVTNEAARAANKATMLKAAADREMAPTLKELPNIRDRFFVFRDPTAVDYDPGLDRATCEVRYTVDMGVFKHLVAVMDPEGKVYSQRQIELMDRMRAVQKATGDLPTRHYAVQPDGRGHTRVILLTR